MENGIITVITGLKRCLFIPVWSEGGSFHIYDYKKEWVSFFYLTLIYLFFTMVSEPALLLMISVTVYVPFLVYLWVGLRAVDVAPSPNFQA